MRRYPTDNFGMIFGMLVFGTFATLALVGAGIWILHLVFGR